MAGYYHICPSISLSGLSGHAGILWGQKSDDFGLFCSAMYFNSSNQVELSGNSSTVYSTSGDHLFSVQSPSGVALIVKADDSTDDITRPEMTLYGDLSVTGCIYGTFADTYVSAGTFDNSTNCITLTRSDDCTVDVDISNYCHSSLAGVVADQHVAHSNININTGTGLCGGGNIASSRTLSLSGQAETLHNLTVNNSSLIAKDSGGTFVSISSSSFVDVTGDTITGDLIVEGDLTVQGTTTTLNTEVCTTSAMEITNAGTGPALVVNQTGSQPVVDFQDDCTSVFYIEDGGNVGIGTSDPNAKLTVAGVISSNNAIWSGSYNSSNWTEAYNNYICDVSVTGTGTKTVTLTQNDGGTITTTFTDKDTIYTGWSLSASDTSGTFNIASGCTGSFCGGAGIDICRVDNEIKVINTITNNNQLSNGCNYIKLTSLSAGAEGTPAGDGSLAYNNTTGVFTYTPPVINDSTITISAGTDLSTGGSFTLNQSSGSTITINHDDITRTNSTSTASPAHGGTFTAIDSITSSARGHITAVNTKTVTLPVGYTGWNLYTNTTDRGTITDGEQVRFCGGTDISLGYTATNNVITINHDTVSSTSSHSGCSVGYGGTFTVVCALSATSQGHTCCVGTMTITLPASDENDTTYDISASSTTGGANLNLNAGGSGSGTDSVKLASGTGITVSFTDASTITINHPTQTAITCNCSNGTVLQDISINNCGHVTSVGYCNLDNRYCQSDSDTTYDISASTSTCGANINLNAGGSGSGTDTIKLCDGNGINVCFTDANTITICHTDTSSQASVNNSNGTVIQDVTLDGFGHVTGLTSYNLDGRYYTESEINTLLGNYCTSSSSDSTFLLNTTDTLTGNLTVTGNVSAAELWDNGNRVLTSQISHADVLVDGDFSSQGIMLRGASAGSYSILTNNSSNWNTAYGWGNHATAGYLTTSTSFGGDVSGTYNSIVVANDSHTHTCLAGFGGQAEYDLIRAGNNNGLYFKARWDAATSNRYWDMGFVDGNGTFYTGLCVCNGGDLLYKNNEVWHAGNDGSGSGLDADTVDGLHGTCFIRCTGVADQTISNASTILRLRSTNAGCSMLILGQSTDGSQATGVLELTQDGSYGGGISYNGDGTPAFVSGETADHVTFYNLNAGTRTEVFHYPYNSTVVNFNSTPTVGSSTVWHAGNDGSGSTLDADLLDGQHGSYYSNYNNLSNKPTIPTVYDSTITITAGTDLATGGSFTLNQNGACSITINHNVIGRTNTTSSASPAHSGTFTVVDSITTSSTGHITGVNTKTVTLPADNNTVYTHPTQTAITCDCSNGIVLQDITVNTLGHVTAVGAYDLDNRYYTETESDNKYLLNTTDTLTGNLTVTGNVSAAGLWDNGNRVCTSHNHDDRYLLNTTDTLTGNLTVTGCIDVGSCGIFKSGATSGSPAIIALNSSNSNTFRVSNYSTGTYLFVYSPNCSATPKVQITGHDTNGGYIILRDGSSNVCTRICTTAESLFCSGICASSVYDNGLRVCTSFTLPSHTHTLANITDAGTAAACAVADFAAASHTHTLANITDAGTAAACAVADFALAGHNHTGVYDNYGCWKLYTAGTAQADIGSGAGVNFIAGNNVTISYGTTSGQNDVTISASGGGTVNNSTICFFAGTDLETSFGNGTYDEITLNQSSNENITFNHSDVARTNSPGGNCSPGYGGTMPVVTAITSSSTGHITGVTTTNIVLPAAVTQYTDSDVDTHLNRSAASSGYVLSWNGSDYAWVAQSGGGSTYTASTGLTLTGTAFSISTACQTAIGNGVTAYNDSITAISVTGTNTKTITLTQRDNSTITTTFTDNEGSGGATYYGGNHITIDGSNNIDHDSPGSGVNFAGCSSATNYRIRYVEWDAYGHITDVSAFTVTSDYRAKTCIQPYENAYNMVKLVDTYKYVFKEEINEENKEEHVGMMAHELQEAGVTYGVTGYKDQVDENGDPVYQSVDLERLVPTLWSALKTAINKIEDLEDRLATLELQSNT